MLPVWDHRMWAIWSPAPSDPPAACSTAGASVRTRNLCRSESGRASPACRSRTVLWGPWRRRRPRRAARARPARPGRSRTRSWPAMSPCRRGCATHSVRLPRLRKTSETSEAHQLFSPWSAPKLGNGSEIGRRLRKERGGRQGAEGGARGKRDSHQTQPATEVFTKGVTIPYQSSLVQ